MTPKQKPVNNKKSRELKVKGNGDPLESPTSGPGAGGFTQTSSLALIRSDPTFIQSTTLPPLIFLCAISRHNSMQPFTMYLVGEGVLSLALPLSSSVTICKLFKRPEA